MNINKRIELQSQSLNALKVIMILFVIYIHKNPTAETCGEVAMWWNSINVVAVPVFFIISGYFFFYNTNVFDKTVYKTKLKKRFKTLLIPYMIWNLLPVFLITGGNFYSIIFRGKSFDALNEFYTGLWNEGLWHIWWYKTSGLMPFDSPLWYIRDLIIVCIFTPIIFWCIKRTGWIFSFILGILYLSNIWLNIIGFSSTAFCFFTIGATFALKNKLLTDFNRNSFIILAVFVLGIYITANIAHISAIQRIFILSSAILWTMTSSLLPEKLIMKLNIITPAVFFIYAIHNTFVLANTSKFLLRVVDEKVCFWISPIITMLICTVMYFVMKKLFPKTMSFLCGGR